MRKSIYEWCPISTFQIPDHQPIFDVPKVVHRVETGSAVKQALHSWLTEKRGLENIKILHGERSNGYAVIFAFNAILYCQFRNDSVARRTLEKTLCTAAYL